MRIVDFDSSHTEEARLIAIQNYNEEREHVPELPGAGAFPELVSFAANGLGVAAFEEDRMIGFLCCYEPRLKAFNSQAKGTFSPIHAHAAVRENRGMIYKKMYQAAAGKWIKQEILYHAIALYAHDIEAKDAWFTCGFGLRCVDAVRPMAAFQCSLCKGISFEELAASDIKDIRGLRRSLTEHMGSSPCFMYTAPEDFEKWLDLKEKHNSRVFVARDNQRLIAFVEITDDGENFATEEASMVNICGAFCLPEYRGRDIYQNLLNHTILQMSREGYKILGVDFESFNPTANGFWLKYFTAYTNSVVRRVDECALHD